jgi:elongation factor G
VNSSRLRGKRAYRNKGIQPLLDAVTDYLPDPSEVENFALDLDAGEKQILLVSESRLPLVALAFKLEDGQYGQLTYIRIYQGSLKKGTNCITRAAQEVQGWKAHPHARLYDGGHHRGRLRGYRRSFRHRLRIRDTFVKAGLNYSMTSMYVPTPVISLAVTPRDKKSSDNMGKALNRFTKEDPTFRSFVAPESNETIIQGMGELHLEVYIERMKREYKAEVDTGMPQVAYREAISQRADFNYTHKKQTGGSGSTAGLPGTSNPSPKEPMNSATRSAEEPFPRTTSPRATRASRPRSPREP